MYDVKVTDGVQRKATIDSLKANATKKGSIFYKDEIVELPVIRISITLPLYRVRNGRTSVDQFEYIQENNLSTDFFVNGQENESVQNIQHRILVSLSKDSKGPIFQELEHVRVQTENLIITADGVVVNGNRRLAAMRELNHDDPVLFSQFNYVNTIVLPEDATETDIEMIETDLQLAPETKLEYGWIQRRLKMRRQLEELRIPINTIKKTYRFERIDDMNSELQQLALAEEYLEKFLGQPFAYKEVSNSEQLFKDMQKAISTRNGIDSELRALVGFHLIKESRNLGDRAYGFRDLYGKEFDNVMQRFAEEEEIELNGTGSSENFDDDDPLSGLDIESRSTYEPLKDILKDNSKSEQTIKKLIDILESVRFGQDEDKVKRDALKKVQDAHRILSNIDISRSDPDTHNQISGQLDAIVAICTHLKSQLRRNS